MANAGVYEIRNTINGHRYIGGSVDLSARIRSHKNALLTHKHRNVHLQRAWNKYGEESFSIQPILLCDRENVLLYEQVCLNGLHPEYNIAKDTTAPMTGLMLSEEQKAKISKSMKGKKRTEEHQRRLNESARGAKRSDEARRHMSEAHKGIPLSKEHILHRVESRNGYTHSDETKQKMSNSAKHYWAMKRGEL